MEGATARPGSLQRQLRKERSALADFHLFALAGVPTAAVGVPLAVVLLVLLAAILHATWNAIAKALDQATAFWLIAVVETVWGALVLACSRPPAAASWSLLGLSIALELAYNVFLLNAYRFGDLGEVYPLARGMAPLLVALAASLFLGEALSRLQVLGLALVAGGLISLVSLGKRQAGRDPRSLGYALLTGLTISAYSFVDGVGVRLSHSPFGYAGVLFAVQGLCTAVGLYLWRGKALWQQSRRALALGALGGILSPTAYTIVLWAQTQTHLAIVSALRETGVLFAAVIGALFLRERFGARRILAAAVVTAGVLLLVG